MQLVDAIESWGRAHRSAFESGEAEALADVWRTVRSSEHATLDVASMSKDQARSVMGVFPAEERASVAATLNKVRKWTIAQAKEAAAAPADSSPPIVAIGEDPGVGPGNLAEDTVTIDGSGMVPSARETLPAAGPVEGWQPPTTVDDPPIEIDQRIIMGLVGLLLAVVLIWLLFLRGGDADTPEPADTGTDPVEDVVAVSNQEFLNQFDLAPDVGACLADEFGDLAAAATNATLRERQVCGTSLLEVITAGG